MFKTVNDPPRAEKKKRVRNKQVRKKSVGGQTPICPWAGQAIWLPQLSPVAVRWNIHGRRAPKKNAAASVFFCRSQTYGTRTGGVNRRKKDGRCGGSRRADVMAPKGGRLWSWLIPVAIWPLCDLLIANWVSAAHKSQKLNGHQHIRADAIIFFCWTVWHLFIRRRFKRIRQPTLH